jgi:predicted transposase/invertase (TIGR01784 family)
MLAVKFPQIAKAVETLREINRRMWMSYRYSRDLQYKAGWAQWSREKDRYEEGISQGTISAKLEIARKMKTRGIALDQIAADTSLSVEEIDSL